MCILQAKGAWQYRIFERKQKLGNAARAVDPQKAHAEDGKAGACQI